MAEYICLLCTVTDRNIAFLVPPFKVYLLSFGKLVVNQLTSCWQKISKRQSRDNCIISLFNSNIIPNGLMWFVFLHDKHNINAVSENIWISPLSQFIRLTHINCIRSRSSGALMVEVWIGTMVLQNLQQYGCQTGNKLKEKSRDLSRNSSWFFFQIKMKQCSVADTKTVRSLEI